MIIEFDPTKDLINQAKHGVSLAMAQFLNWETAVIDLDDRFNYGEVRLVALGLLDQRVYHISFTERETARRIISFRKANSREVRKYVSHHEKR